MNTEKRKSDARRLLESMTGGRLRLGDLLVSIRLGEGISQAEVARELGVSRAHLCDIEKGRKTLSPARAAEFARILGYGEAQFVRLALQEQLEQAGLDFKVHIEAA